MLPAWPNPRRLHLLHTRPTGTPPHQVKKGFETRPRPLCDYLYRDSVGQIACPSGQAQLRGALLDKATKEYSLYETPNDDPKSSLPFSRRPYSTGSLALFLPLGRTSTSGEGRGEMGTAGLRAPFLDFLDSRQL